MYRTRPVEKLASTRAGMRRILKKLPPLTAYIRKAVETGVYRSNEEIEEAMRNLRNSYEGVSDEAPDYVVNSFRRNFKRGISVMDYPPEYHILSLHPPIPDPPRIPKKLQRRMIVEQEAHPAESLVRKALQRNLSQQTSPAQSSGDTSENYYQKLLGIPPPSTDSAMGQKSALLSRSYVIAMKQYELMRTKEMSEREALEEVDRLLAKEAKEESEQSRSVAESIQEYYANENIQPPRQEKWGGKLDSLKDDYKPDAETDKRTTDYTFSQEQNGDVELTSIPSILHSQPRVLQGMMQWSDMLRQVPYQQWTIGASTALDHWIARNVLQLSEETWESLLEGNDPSLLSRGRDVVALRETLFPETGMNVSDAAASSRHEEEAAMIELAATGSDNTTAAKEEERSIDDLLESLRGLDNSNKVTSPDELTGKVAAVNETDADDDDEIDALVQQLQEWRTKNVESPYESWSVEEQTEFSAWLQRYVNTLTSPQDRSFVDMDETRVALLASPPVQSKEESDSFWKNLQDETMADVFLQKLLADGPPSNATDSEKEFWSLSYQQQLSKIVELGAVRPLLDEYASDAERKDFMSRYGDFLLEGVELEHLVQDPKGNIRGADLGVEMVRKLKIGSKDSFKLVKLPYKKGSDGSLDRGRALYYAWNQQKAGRARYEEAMFHQGELGLRYDDPPPRQVRNDEFK